MTFENSFKVAWTSQSDGYGSYGYPIFWFSSDKYKEEPIKLPMTLDNNPGLMLPTALSYAKLSGARLHEQCHLMTNARGIRKIYETPKTITGLDIANLAVTSILATGTPSRIAYPAAFSYPNVIRDGYNGGGGIFFYEDLTSTAGGIGSADIQERLKALKTILNWEYFVAELTKRGATKEGIEIIRKNSCLLYVLGNNIGDSDGSLGGLLARSGSGWGISYGNPPESYVLFNGVSIPGSKILPQQFYYKTNSYANCYLSPSLCVTKMWIDFCDGKGFQERALPTCTTGLNPTDLNNSADNIETSTELKNQDSEYIRRDHPREQEVSTDLNFTGKVKVPTPVNANDVATKGYADSKVSSIINDIATQNPTLEKLHKIEWALEPLSDSTTGATPTSMGLSFCQFLDDSQMPLQLVAFSLDEDTQITNFNNGYLMGKYWTAYFAPTTTNNLASAKWNVKEARQMLKTLTPEDEDYLNAYDYIIKMKVQVDNVASVNYLPISIFNYQKVKIPSTAATSITSGQNLSIYGGAQVRIWIDDEDSLSLFKLHIKNMIFSTYVYANANGYGTFRVRVSSILNDKYVDFNHVFNQFTQDKQITNSSFASKAYMVSLNLVRDSTYNKKTISPSITGLLLNNKTPILYWREWDDGSQGFVFRERTYAEANADVPT